MSRFSIQSNELRSTALYYEWISDCRKNKRRKICIKNGDSEGIQFSNLDSNMHREWRF